MAFLLEFVVEFAVALAVLLAYKVGEALSFLLAKESSGTFGSGAAWMTLAKRAMMAVVLIIYL